MQTMPHSMPTEYRYVWCIHECIHMRYLELDSGCLSIITKLTSHDYVLIRHEGVAMHSIPYSLSMPAAVQNNAT